MAITSAIMQMRRGNEADFDPDKMHPGEWAVSTDKKYVRMCFSPGVCVRMATYDAFEADMSQIQDILTEAKSIEEAINRINTEVSINADLVEEYTEEAKRYRDEAEQFRNEAFYNTPEGYDELVQNVEDNTVKLDTIIEKAELNIKNTATGENIHLTDSADAKVVEFGLYGKAEQKQYSGKNKLINTATDGTTAGGITFTVKEDKTINVDASTSTESAKNVAEHTLENGEYILSGRYTERCFLRVLGNKNGSWETIAQTSNADNIKFTMDNSVYTKILVQCIVLANTSISNATIYPMIRLARITDDTYEPYVGGMPSPSPDYPQDIKVAGADGSVEVVSCGKNLLKNTAVSVSKYGITYTVKENGSITANGTSTANADLILFTKKASELYKYNGYILSGSIAGSLATYNMRLFMSESPYTAYAACEDGETTINNIPNDDSINVRLHIRIMSGQTVNNITFYPMISAEGGDYEPYKETVSTIPTPDGLAGIPVDSGGNYTDSDGQQWVCDEIIKYADGSGKRIQRIGKSILSSAYNYVLNVSKKGILLSNASTTICPNIKNASNRNVRMMSNIRLWLKGDAWNSGSFGVEGDTFWFEDTGNVLFPTVDDWKNYLDENEVIMYYELAEPIITDLTAAEIEEIEKLHTFYPITNISNDADCGMTVTYLADAKLYIDSRLALIESAIINNI